MKHPEDCDSIRDVRQAIDTLDHEIIRLIGRRAGYVEAAALFRPKRPMSLPGTAGHDARNTPPLGRENSLDPHVIEDLYRNHVSYFVVREMHQWRETCSQSLPAPYRETFSITAGGGPGVVLQAASHQLF